MLAERPEQHRSGNADVVAVESKRLFRCKDGGATGECSPHRDGVSRTSAVAKLDLHEISRLQRATAEVDLLRGGGLPDMECRRVGKPVRLTLERLVPPVEADCEGVLDRCGLVEPKTWSTLEDGMMEQGVCEIQFLVPSYDIHMQISG